MPLFLGVGGGWFFLLSTLIMTTDLYSGINSYKQTTKDSTKEQFILRNLINFKRENGVNMKIQLLLSAMSIATSS